MKVNLAEKLAKISTHWDPHVAAELNGQCVKLAKLHGAFIWHKHDDEDELFLVVKGSLRMAFRDREEVINEGEFIVVPKGVEHKPIADKEVEVMLFEPKETLNTGDQDHALTKKQLKHI
ncbi:MAG: cupin domain-containing protein [Salibacteraceae bacterium]